MKKEIRIFFTAIMFFTRIPCPKWVDHSEEYLSRSSKYFPLVGWIVGGFSALIYLLCTYILPVPIAILLSMAASIYITGAFHEDGLADVCDGFGGGWTKEKIMNIMKDSRVGAFGVIGLVIVLLLKFVSLTSVPIYSTLIIPFILISAHSLSRFVAVTFLMTHEYARVEGSKSKPLTAKMSGGDFMISMVTGVLPLLLFSYHFRRYELLILIIPVYLTKIALGGFFKKWIGGYTGDCLGATQQICEIVFYLSFLILWKFI